MAKYRKKPVVIEAFQMNSKNRNSYDDWPQWLFAALKKDRHCDVGALWFTASKCFIRTLEGKQLVSKDDFIIQGVKGEIYPCKPDIFAATYEALTSEDKT